MVIKRKKKKEKNSKKMESGKEKKIILEEKIKQGKQEYDFGEGPEGEDIMKYFLNQTENLYTSSPRYEVQRSVPPSVGVKRHFTSYGAFLILHSWFLLQESRCILHKLHSWSNETPGC